MTKVVVMNTCFSKHKTGATFAAQGALTIAVDGFSPAGQSFGGNALVTIMTPLADSKDVVEKMNKSLEDAEATEREGVHQGYQQQARTYGRYVVVPSPSSTPK